MSAKKKNKSIIAALMLQDYSVSVRRIVAEKKPKRKDTTDAR